MCFRTGKAGELIIDDINRVEGESLGNLQMLNVEGNIYLGACVFCALVDIKDPKQLQVNYVPQKK